MSVCVALVSTHPSEHMYCQMEGKKKTKKNKTLHLYVLLSVALNVSFAHEGLCASAGGCVVHSGCSLFTAGQVSLLFASLLPQSSAGCLISGRAASGFLLTLRCFLPVRIIDRHTAPLQTDTALFID